MKRKVKNNKGITLITLVITVIVIAILASVATYSGIEVINSSKLTRFTTEMKIIQTKVNEIYEDKENRDKYKEKGNEINENEFNTKINSIGKEYLKGLNYSTNYSDYRFYDKDKLKSDLGIEDIEQSVFIDIEHRKIISSEGITVDGKTYYVLEQLPNSLYNVDYEQNTNKPDMKIGVEAIENDKWKISISDIEYEGNIEKWEVKYQLEGQEYWSKSKNLSFVVDKVGIYKITISNGEVTSDEKTIAIGVAELEPEQSSLTNLSSMLYGVIEIEFLDGTSYRIKSDSNTPILKDGMEPVYWGDEVGNINTNNPQSNTVEIKKTSANYKESNWYRYIAQTGETDGKTSRWANAITSDGSYYVWIPRYAYRIIYFNTQANENAYRAGTLTEEEALSNNYIVGYSDSRGIVDKEGKRPTSVTSTTAISINDKHFRVHPVFDGNPDEGGWDSKLAGIWVMKYEASRNDATATALGTGTTPKSVPNVKSWVNTNVSTMFTVAKNFNTTLKSHMMKNSEWGVVAYLTESKYGRNGTEISVNQCSDQITGIGKGTGDNAIYNSEYVYSAITEEQKYYGTIGQLSSTTGNTYGIYDISGGTNEYVMGFYGTDANTPKFGSSGFTTATFPSEKKYYQIYLNSNGRVDNADGGMLGDATKETKQWNGDKCDFVNSTYPVFRRGCSYISPGNAGIFYCNGFSGIGSENFSFRVCLLVQ